jgi:hypothetical protein
VKLISFALAFVLQAAGLFASPALGEWTITPKYQKDENGVIVIPEVRHPVALRVFQSGSGLKVEITDNDHLKSVWSAVAIDGGHELIIFKPESWPGSELDFVPIHRVKFRGDECIGITSARYLLVEWTGKAGMNRRDR